MSRAGKLDAETYKKCMLRSNTTLLMLSILLFQFTAMLLVALKKSPIDLQALCMAVAMPAVTWLVAMGFSRLWPIDRALLLLILLLCSVSLITLQDIARAAVTPRTQAYYILLGIPAMAVGILVARCVRSWEKWLKPIMALTLLGVALPIALGEWQYGAKNWIRLFGVSVQPSEFGKPALIFVLAAALSGQRGLRKNLLPLLFAAALCVLLLVERDLGALLLYYLTTVFLFYAATSNLPLTLSGLGAGAAGALIAYKLFPYVAKRVEMFLNPWSDPLDKGWQIIQALIAIGSGGLFGMGLGLGYPRNIPLYHSDFVFAAISEEFGLIFSLCLLAVYVLLLMRGTSVALGARTGFHALLAFGVVAMLGLQTLVIVGGNIKLIPLTGVTLPFISAGGSSMVSTMAMAGLLLGVSSINAVDEVADLARLTGGERP